MCKNCWREYGAPEHASPEIELAAALICAIYEAEPAGGPLHAELDDWNIDGTWAPWGKPSDFDPDAWRHAVELCALMNGLPVSDRAAALGRYDGFTA